MTHQVGRKFQSFCLLGALRGAKPLNDGACLRRPEIAQFAGMRGWAEKIRTRICRIQSRASRFDCAAKKNPHLQFRGISRSTTEAVRKKRPFCFPTLPPPHITYQARTRRLGRTSAHAAGAIHLMAQASARPLPRGFLLPACLNRPRLYSMPRPFLISLPAQQSEGQRKLCQDKPDKQDVIRVCPVCPPGRTGHTSIDASCCPGQIAALVGQQAPPPCGEARSNRCLRWHVR